MYSMTAMQSPRVLITGVAGFLGSNTAEYLQKLGWYVVGLDALAFTTTPRQELERNWQALALPLFVQCDIRDTDELQRLFRSEQPELVINMAGIANIGKTYRTPELTDEINAKAVRQLLQIAQEHKTKQCILASTSAIYAQSLFAVDEGSKLDPVSPYAKSKASMEKLAQTMTSERMHITTLRLFTGFGPRCRPDMAISRFKKAIEEQTQIVLHGSDLQRDYIHAMDIAQAVEFCWHKRDVLEPYSCLNIGSGWPTSLTTIVATLNQFTNIPVVVDHTLAPPSTPPCTWADIAHAKRTIHFEPQKSILNELQANPR